MARLLILAKRFEEYQRVVESAGLPGLERLAASASPSEALALGRDFDILLGEPALIQAVLDGLPQLRWVQSIWAGVEPLLAAGLRRDYVLSNARGVFGGLMSEFVFSYLLFHERRILERFQAQQGQRWDDSITGSLSGKTIGLLGVGSIGSVLAGTAKHFGMKVRGYTHSSETCREVDAYYHGSGLAGFAGGLDYLVDVLPNTPHTRRIVDADLLARLAEQAVFVNAGRGATVDELALAAALQNGRLAMAVLDVFEQEPLPAEHVFWHTPNLYMTFHTSAPSLPADLGRLFIENYRRYLSGQPILYRIDFERGY